MLFATVAIQFWYRSFDTNWSVGLVVAMLSTIDWNDCVICRYTYQITFDLHPGVKLSLVVVYSACIRGVIISDWISTRMKQMIKEWLATTLLRESSLMRLCISKVS